MGATIDNNGRYAIISDLQIPYEHKHALDFVKRICREFRIPKENMICIGDETDQYFASQYPKDADAQMDPRKELQLGRDRLKAWWSAFPCMMVCNSNHGLRWLAKAFDCYIPSEVIRPYKDLFGLPDSWQYRDSWLIKEKHPFRAIHGMGYSGMAGARNAAIDGHISTVIGHLHAHASAMHIKNDGLAIWGMNVGCLIDCESFAFKYGRYSRFKPMLSMGIVLNHGSTPLVVPYE